LSFNIGWLSYFCVQESVLIHLQKCHQSINLPDCWLQVSSSILPSQLLSIPSPGIETVGWHSWQKTQPTKCNVGYSLVFVYIHTLSYYKLFLYYKLCLSLMLDNLSCSFTSTPFLTTSCSFNTREYPTLHLVTNIS
jgi:hypothetical protein